MGPSGYGESTLLHLLGGLDDPDHGSILLGDEDVANSASAPAVLRRHRVGYVFQQYNLIRT